MLTPTVFLSVRLDVPDNIMRSVIAMFLATTFATTCYANDVDRIGVGLIFMILLFAPYGMWAACVLAFLQRKGLPVGIRRFVLILCYLIPVIISYIVSDHSFRSLPYFMPMFIIATLAGIAMYRWLKSSNEAIEKNRVK